MRGTRLIGTVDEMVEELLRREHYGMSSLMVAEAGIEAFAPLVGLGAPSDVLERREASVEVR